MRKLATVSQILRANGVATVGTPYFVCDEFYFEYPLHFLGVTNCVKYLDAIPEFSMTCILEKEKNILLSQCKVDGEFITFLMQNNCGGTATYSQDIDIIDKKRTLRFKKKVLYGEIYTYLSTKYGFNVIDGISLIKVRNFCFVNSIDSVIEIFPQLHNSYLTRKCTPLFTYKLKRFADNLATKKSAIEGGTCIIGVDETYICLKYRDGGTKHFDVMTGSLEGPLNQYQPRRYDLSQVIINDKNDITGVDILEKRTGPSLHNAIELYRLMWLAKKLDLPLVIGLPDSTYKNLLRAATAPLSNLSNIDDKIDKFINKITDEFIALISEINEVLKLTNLEVLHSRNTKIIDIFYTRRHVIAEHAVNMPSIELKKDAVIDYNCLPAVPSFLWGATNILEISDIMEMENLKASIKLFPEISFGALAFPYIPDLNNTSSMYHGNSENKVFISQEFIKNLKSNKLMSSLCDNITCQFPWLENEI